MKENKEKNPEVQEEAPEEVQEQSAEPSELETVKSELNEAKEQLLRMAADYDNFRRRSQREKEAIFTDSKVHVVREFLPVMDNLERAVANENASFEDYKKGMGMIIEQLNQAVSKLGVEAFGEEGDAFNPVYHNAIMHIEDENLGENVITKVFQKGYKIGDSVLRHAMVETAN